MHRPERLDGLVVSVLGYRLVRALAQLACPDPGHFQRIQRVQPGAERARIESIVAAICDTTHTTSTPRLDVQRPEGTTCLVLEASHQSHWRSSTMRRNPISFASGVRHPDAYGRLPTAGNRKIKAN